MERRRAVPAVLALLIALASPMATAGCGVLASEGSGDDNLPDARLGPFRTFGEDEVSLPPLVVLDFTASLGGPELVERGADGAVLYLHASADGEEVTHLRRQRGTSPTAFEDPEIILEGDPEGLRDPAVVLDGAATLLYFGVGTGERIGVARATGAGAFAIDEEPVLVAEDPAAAPIGAPSVVQLDGTWLLYTARGRSIALATSTDGRTFEDQGVVLGPGEETSWDAGGVGDPEAVVVPSPLGGHRVRLYYTGWSANEEPERGVGVAVSFDGLTDFHRYVGNPVVGLDGDELAPAVSVGAGDAPTLLYFTRPSGSGRLGIAGAVLPGDVSFAATP